MESCTQAGSDQRLPSPTKIVGAILGFGVIRMLSKKQTERRSGVAGPTSAASSHGPSASAPKLTPPTLTD